MNFDELEQVLRTRQEGRRRERRILVGALGGLAVVGLLIAILVIV